MIVNGLKFMFYLLDVFFCEDDLLFVFSIWIKFLMIEYYCSCLIGLIKRRKYCYGYINMIELYF